jgi:ABC-type polysaccharide/polyol phosphate export permease
LERIAEHDIGEEPLISKLDNTTVFDAQQRRTFVGYILKSVRDVVRYRFVLYNLISTNLRSRYRRSTIGFLWSLLNPLFTMTILAIVFSSIYRLSFTEFGLYIMSGLLPWNLISNSLLNGSSALIRSEGYLKKVHVPKLIFPLSVLGVEIVNFLLSLVSLFFLAFLLGAKAGWSLLFLPVALLLLSVFLLGIIMAISIFTVYFRDFSHILQVGLLGIFYLTPVIYPANRLSPKLLKILSFNPFYYFVELFHEIIKSSAIPSKSMWLICVSLSLVSMLVGILFFRARENDIIYRL